MPSRVTLFSLGRYKLVQVGGGALRLSNSRLDGLWSRRHYHIRTEKSDTL